MDAPFLRPLVAYLDDAPNIGVVVLSQDGARLMTWRQGLIDQGSETEIKPSSHPLRPEGPPEGNPTRGPHAASPADQLRNRVSDHLRKFANEVASALPKEAIRGSWERIFVAGPSPLREEFQAYLGQPWRSVVIGSEDKVMTRATSGEIAQVIEPVLDRWNRERERREIFETIDIANSGGRAVTGVDGCLKLLQEGRVSHLYFASDLSMSGLRRTDGTLTTLMDLEGVEGTEEPYLVERMVELALETGADVTPVESEVVMELKDLGGVAARLRY
jgi:stalled ribosome rescue protein Dom34